MNKDILLGQIDEIFLRLDRVASGLTPDDMLKPVALADGESEGWTIGDCLVHLAAWKRNAIRIADYQIGGSPPEDDYPTAILGLNRDGFNADLIVKWKGKTATEILEEHRAAHRLLVGKLSKLSPGRLLVEDEDGLRARKWLKPALSHTVDHLEEQILPVVGG
ncbi:MAG: DinB family protein [Acidimicrobiia bacterium]